MIDSKIVSVSYARDLADKTPPLEEARAKVNRLGDSSQMALVEAVRTERHRYQSDGSYDCLRLSVSQSK